VVTNEVGSGVVPETVLGRRFRDVAGRANEVIARGADEVYFMVSGIPLRIKPRERNDDG
jgi:adenosylcobinamide kinase/adenosylcobinamide-phosphate guanylyltransferase